MCEKYKEIKELIKEAEIVFQENFGNKLTIKAFGPGRINIIGEHTDYNDGYVFPMALPIGTLIIGCKNNLNSCRILTMSNELTHSKLISFAIPLDGEIKKSKIKWINYVIGVVAYYKCKEKMCFDAVINNSVPIGSGLSSSASLEVAVFTFLDQLYQEKDKLNLIEKALLCQKVEHDYAEVPCGIMDQFIGFMGKKHHALLIDCKNLSSTLIKFEENSLSILIINSNIKHDLGSSEYPQRRKHCHLAATLLNKKSLRDLSYDDLEDSKEKLERIVYIRARHVITENKRVLDAVEALHNSDFIKLGSLMNESHKSLRDDFEVSCKEVDQLVEIVQSCQGVLGSRITGGGFGGCTISLVYNDEIQNVITEVKKNYIGNPVFYICTADDGARLCD